MSSLERHKRHEHGQHTSGVGNSINHIEHNHSIVNDNSIHDNSVDNSIHTTNTTNNITGPVNIHVNLQVFGTELIKHIMEDEAFIKECLEQIIGQGIPNLVEKIYFNKQVPENQNVKMQREHHPSLMNVFTKTGWVEQPTDDVVEKMIIKGKRILQSKVSEQFSSVPITDSSRNMFDLRSEKLNNIANKKKGVYGPVKHGVIAKARKHKKMLDTSQ